MPDLAPRRRLRLTATLTLSLLAGCSGPSTPDTVPTAPPLTPESLKDKAKEINANQGGMKSPGVKTQRP